MGALRFLRWVGAAALVVLSSSCVNTKPPALLSEGCLINSDCQSPLVCAFRRCHTQCDSDRDCPAGNVCRTADKPFNVCLLPDELRCLADRDCPGTLICGQDGVCRDTCRNDGECLENQRCVRGTCAAVTELVGGDLPLASDAGLRCLYNSECPLGQTCRQGLCLAECLTSRDCTTGAFCANGVCTVIPAGGDGGFGAPCALPSDCGGAFVCTPGGVCGLECQADRDCDSTLSECCRQNRCVRGLTCLGDGGTPFDGGPTDAGAACLTDFQCQDTLFCNGSERCVAGRCTSSARSICDDGNPCTVDSCDETLRQCGPPVMTIAIDDDNDGHFPVVCGGSADDCDDREPTVYRGASERCDFKDNDCDGLVDESLWSERLSARGSVSNGLRHPVSGGAPRAAKLGSGVFVAAASDRTSGSLDVYRLDAVTLSPQAGPVVLGGSETSWDTCVPNVTTLYGKRVGRAELESNGTELLASGVATTYPSPTCCNTGLQPVLTTFYRRVSPALALAGLDAGVLANHPYTSNACDSLGPGSSVAERQPAVAWSATLGRWIIVWSPYVTGTALLYMATLDPATGALSTPRVVLPGPAGLTRSEVNVRAAETPGWTVAVSPTRVLITWPQYSANYVRYVVYDSTLTNLVAGPVDMVVAGLGSMTNVHRSEWDGRDFVLAVEYTTPARVGLVKVSEQGVLDPAFRYFASISPSVSQELTSGTRIAFSLSGDAGLLLGVTQGSKLRFGWGRREADGGLQELDVDVGLPAAQHTDFSIVPLDDRSAAVFYSDGDVRKLVLECNE